LGEAALLPGASVARRRYCARASVFARHASVSLTSGKSWSVKAGLIVFEKSERFEGSPAQGRKYFWQMNAA
jgi:hypothetical protein